MTFFIIRVLYKSVLMIYTYDKALGVITDGFHALWESLLLNVPSHSFVNNQGVHKADRLAWWYDLPLSGVADLIGY